MEALHDPTIAFLNKLNDQANWQVITSAPIFIEHERDAKGKDGGDVKIAIGRDDLAHIAEQINEREQEYGVPAVITIGHRVQTNPTYNEKDQPDIVGYARHARVGVFGPKQTPAVLADLYIEKCHWNEARKYPFRSVDFYPGSNKVTGVALLKRDPFLAMGVIAYQGEAKKKPSLKAPNGGIVIDGYFFRAGAYIPPRYVDKLTSEQISKCLGGSQGKGPVEYSMARGKVAPVPYAMPYAMSVHSSPSSMKPQAGKMPGLAKKDADEKKEELRSGARRYETAGVVKKKKKPLPVSSLPSAILGFEPVREPLPEAPELESLFSPLYTVGGAGLGGLAGAGIGSLAGFDPARSAVVGSALGAGAGAVAGAGRAEGRNLDALEKTDDEIFMAERRNRIRAEDLAYLKSRYIAALKNKISKTGHDSEVIDWGKASGLEQGSDAGVLQLSAGPQSYAMPYAMSVHSSPASMKPQAGKMPGLVKKDSDEKKEELRSGARRYETAGVVKKKKKLLPVSSLPSAVLSLEPVHEVLPERPELESLFSPLHGIAGAGIGGLAGAGLGSLTGHDPVALAGLGSAVGGMGGAVIGSGKSHVRNEKALADWRDRVSAAESANEQRSLTLGILKAQYLSALRKKIAKTGHNLDGIAWEQPSGPDRGGTVGVMSLSAGPQSYAKAPKTPKTPKAPTQPSIADLPGEGNLSTPVTPQAPVQPSRMAEFRGNVAKRARDLLARIGRSNMLIHGLSHAGAAATGGAMNAGMESGWDPEQMAKAGLHSGAVGGISGLTTGAILDSLGGGGRSGEKEESAEQAGYQQYAPSGVMRTKSGAAKTGRIIGKSGRINPAYTQGGLRNTLVGAGAGGISNLIAKKLGLSPVSDGEESDTQAALKGALIGGGIGAAGTLGGNYRAASQKAARFNERMKKGKSGGLPVAKPVKTPVPADAGHPVVVSASGEVFNDPAVVARSNKEIAEAKANGSNQPIPIPTDNMSSPPVDPPIPTPAKAPAPAAATAAAPAAAPAKPLPVAKRVPEGYPGGGKEKTYLKPIGEPINVKPVNLPAGKAALDTGPDLFNNASKAKPQQYAVAGAAPSPEELKQMAASVKKIKQSIKKQEQLKKEAETKSGGIVSSITGNPIVRNAATLGVLGGTAGLIHSGLKSGWDRERMAKGAATGAGVGALSGLYGGRVAGTAGRGLLGAGLGGLAGAALGAASGNPNGITAGLLAGGALGGGLGLASGGGSRELYKSKAKPQKYDITDTVDRAHGAAGSLGGTLVGGGLGTLIGAGAGGLIGSGYGHAGLGASLGGGLGAILGSGAGQVAGASNAAKDYRVSKTKDLLTRARRAIGWSALGAGAGGLAGAGLGALGSVAAGGGINPDVGAKVGGLLGAGLGSIAGGGFGASKPVRPKDDGVEVLSSKAKPQQYFLPALGAVGRAALPAVGRMIGSGAKMAAPVVKDIGVQAGGQLVAGKASQAIDKGMDSLASKAKPQQYAKGPSFLNVARDAAISGAAMAGAGKLIDKIGSSDKEEKDKAKVKGPFANACGPKKYSKTMDAIKDVGRVGVAGPLLSPLGFAAKKNTADGKPVVYSSDVFNALDEASSSRLEGKEGGGYVAVRQLPVTTQRLHFLTEVAGDPKANVTFLQKEGFSLPMKADEVDQLKKLLSTRSFHLKQKALTDAGMLQKRDYDEVIYPDIPKLNDKSRQTMKKVVAPFLKRRGLENAAKTIENMADNENYQAGNSVSYGAEHAPTGGITVGGKRYIGGQFIPAEVMDKATPEEKAALKSAKEGGKPQQEDGRSWFVKMRGDPKPDLKKQPEVMAPALKESITKFIADAPPEYKKEMMEHLNTTMSGRVGDFISKASPDELFELQREVVKRTNLESVFKDRAPKGGVVLEGEFYDEGRPIPKTMVDRATPEERGLIRGSNPWRRAFLSMFKDKNGDLSVSKPMIAVGTIVAGAVAAGLMKSAMAGGGGRPGQPAGGGHPGTPARMPARMPANSPLATPTSGSPASAPNPIVDVPFNGIAGQLAPAQRPQGLNRAMTQDLYGVVPIEAGTPPIPGEVEHSLPRNPDGTIAGKRFPNPQGARLFPESGGPNTPTGPGIISQNDESPVFG